MHVVGRGRGLAPFNREPSHVDIGKNVDPQHICSTLTLELNLKNRVPPPSTMLYVIYASRAFDQDVIHPKCPGIEQYTAFAVENNIASMPSSR